MVKGRRRIAVITGTRAEFGLLVPVLRAVQGRPKLDARLIVTGMHLLPKFGKTIDHIRAGGWRVDAAVPMQSGRDDAAGEAQALARGVAGIARALDRLKCEIVLVLGDRIEAFAGACAAVTSRRVLAHIHGGDRGTGDVDDMLRNAITRLAHVHLAASQDAARRLRRMGEEAGRVHVVGAPGLDEIRGFRARQRLGAWGLGLEGGGGTVGKRGRGRDGETGRRGDAGTRGRGDEGMRGREGDTPYALIVQHPCTRDARREAAIMESILEAVAANGLGGAILYPNSDPGHDGIIRVIRRWEDRPGWHVFPSLPREDYLRLAMDAAVMVGNSSSGIIESASIGVNAVNVGPRQDGRLPCGPNVIDCGETPMAIRKAIHKALARPRPRPGKSVYGDGRAGERIAAILEGLIISPRLLWKALDY